MVVLYSTGPTCIKCNMLERVLKQKGISFEKSFNLEEITSKGFLQGPVLKVDKNHFEYNEALNWVKGR